MRATAASGPLGVTLVMSRSLPPSAMSASVKPKRFRLLV
jgi:hypothetical protein